MRDWWPFGRKPASPVDAPAPIETPPVPVAAPPPPTPLPMPAGAAWCALFPGSNRLEDLASPFRENAERFVAHLISLGCRVEIVSTLRPEQRAWLMRQCWDVVHGLVRLDEVPVRDDIPVRPWTLAGALDMFHGYGLVYRPSLTSRHIQGLALDMVVHNWMASDADLWDLGASFGVHKLVSDSTHWSIDGH